MTVTLPAANMPFSSKWGSQSWLQPPFRRLLRVAHAAAYLADTARGLNIWTKHVDTHVDTTLAWPNSGRMGRANFAKPGATLKRCPPTIAPPHLERGTCAPLQAQVYRWLRRAIWRRELPAGYVLPSTRALAKQLGVSRNTALYAYETLASEGLIGGRRGSGTRVLGDPEGCAAGSKRRRDLSWILRDAHYPVSAVAFADPDGNSLYAHT
jgi:DNA-binding transcriptional regulator YhcF (GntR family)